MKYLTENFNLYLFAIILLIINIILIISSSYGIADFNQILSFEDDEAKLTGWILNNIKNKNLEHLNDFNYGYLYETLNVFLGILLEKLNITQNFTQIAFTGRILSILFFNLSLIIIYKTLIFLNINKIIITIFLSILLFNIDLIYWGHKVHPDLLQFFLLALTAYYLLKVKELKDYYIVTFFCSLAFSVKYGGLFYIPFIFLHFIIYSMKSRIKYNEIIKLIIFNLIIFLVIFYLTNPYQLILFKKSMAFFYNNFKFTSGSSGIDLEITAEWFRIYLKNFGTFGISFILFGIVGFLFYFYNKSLEIYSSLKSRDINNYNINVLVIFIWIIINIFHIFFKVPVVEMRYSFHIIPIIIITSALGYKFILDNFLKYDFIDFGLLIILTLFLIIRPIVVFNNFSYIKSDKGFFYANYAMPLLGMNKYNTDLYKGYLFIKENVDKKNFILYEKGFYLDETYQDQRLVNFISADIIKYYDPDYLVFTKLMTGRFCWYNNNINCRSEVRDDLKEDAKKNLEYFFKNNQLVFENNDVIIFRNN